MNNKYYIYITILLSLFIFNFSYAQKVDEETAKKVAVNFLKERVNYFAYNKSNFNYID